MIMPETVTNQEVTGKNIEFKMMNEAIIWKFNIIVTISIIAVVIINVVTVSTTHGIKTDAHATCNIDHAA
jgi:hypothetical protein